MLVLSRKIDERIHIGENIVVTVLAIRGNRVRLALSAPGDVKILRGEIAQDVIRPAVQVATDTTLTTEGDPLIRLGNV